MQNSSAAKSSNVGTPNSFVSTPNSLIGATTSRVADYTIKGFLYQFHKTILEILSSGTDDEITVEGVVEDIDIVRPDSYEAIQCKYHEAQEHFTPSLIYKPLLQMMDHFHKNEKAGVKYKLYAYFPDKAGGGSWTPTQEDLEKVLSTENAKLTALATSLKGKIKLEAFSKAFSCDFGYRLDVLVEHVCLEFEKNGFSKADIEALAYPHAINTVANLSVAHNVDARKITKGKFLSNLKTVKQITITRWTKELKGRSAMLAVKRRQLKDSLKINARLRYFLVSGKIDRFKEGIVSFVSDYLAKYHCKTAHTQTPAFFLDCSPEDFQDIRERMHERKLPVEDGFVGTRFDREEFFKDDLRSHSVRVARYGSDMSILQSPKCQDLFIISDDDYPLVSPKDVNCERLAVATLQELEYLIGMRGTYE